MNKRVLFLIYILFTSCCGKTDIIKSEFNGNVKTLTERMISIRYDSNNNFIKDTLTETKKKYNDKNQILKLSQKILFANETMDIIYTYNRCNKIQKESVKMSFDSTIVVVDYVYENFMLVKSIAKTTKDSVHFEQIGLNEYDENKILIKSSLSQIDIDLKSNDTIKNNLQVNKHDKKGLVMKSHFKFYKDPSKNNKIEYEYDENELIRMQHFNLKDSLILTSRFEYKKDTLENWIERNFFENNRLKTITTREIIYK